MIFRIEVFLQIFKFDLFRLYMVLVLCLCSHNKQFSDSYFKMNYLKQECNKMSVQGTKNNQLLAVSAKINEKIKKFH